MKKKIFGVAIAALVLGAPLLTFAASYVTLDSWSGTPGTNLTISGGGWNSGDTIEIYFGSVGGTPAAQTTATDGMFSVNAAVPLNLSQGSVAVIAKNAAGNEARNSFYVVPLSPTIDIAAPSHAPGGKISVSGSGFGPNESVTVNLESTSAQVTADSSGAFSGLSLTIPKVNEGVYLVRASGDQTGAQAVYYFWVDRYWPSITPSVWYVEPGKPLSFSGSGFAPFETIKLDLPGVTPPNITANQIGSFTSGELIVPAKERNLLKTFTLTGEQSGASASTMVMIGDLYPYAYPSTYYDIPGSPVSFSGGGYAPGETIDVFNEKHEVETNFKAGATGAFDLAGATTLPFSDSDGTATFSLIGRDSGATSNVAVTLGKYYPSISPSVYYGYPGDQIVLNGSGFAGGETIKIFRGSENLGSIESDNSGAFAASSTLPFGASSPITFRFVGEKSGATAEIGITIGELAPYLTPDKYYALRGETISVSGSRFAAGEDVKVTAGNFSATAKADKNGDTPAVNIPVMRSTGSFLVTFTGLQSGASATVAIGIGSVYQSVTPDLYFAQPGASVTFVGAGFDSNEAVNISLDGKQLGPVSASAQGDFSEKITMPFGATKTSLIFSGTESGNSHAVYITIAELTPSVWLSTYYTKANTPLTIYGSGFAASEPIEINFGGKVIASGESDKNGNLEITTTVPATPYGPYMVSVTGKLSGTKAATAMEVAPTLF